MLGHCVPWCKVSISLSGESATKIEVDVPGEVTDLDDGRSQLFSLEPKQPRFFRVEVTDYLTWGDKGMRVDLHKFLGQAYMVYSLYLDDQVVLPKALGSSHLQRVEVFDAQFFFSKASLGAQLLGSKYKKAFVMIGVFENVYYSRDGESENTGLFRLSVRTNQYDLTSLYEQEQHSVTLSSGQSQFFLFEQYSSLPLEVSFVRDSLSSDFLLKALPCPSEYSLTLCQALVTS